MRKYRGGYANATARVPMVGDMVRIGDNTDTYQVTAYNQGDQMVTLSDGAGVHHNSSLNLVSGDGYQAPQEHSAAMPQSPQSFGEISAVENDDEEHDIDGPPYDDEESYERWSENSRETTGLVDSGTTAPNSRRGSNTSTILQDASTISQAQTDSEDGSDDGIIFNHPPAGGKRRKSKRRTKRKLKWDNKATIAVVATTVAFDKTLPPTDLTDPSGGKKTKRRKSKSRKKPRSLKKRVR